MSAYSSPVTSCARACLKRLLPDLTCGVVVGTRGDYHRLISIVRTHGLHGRPDLAASAYRCFHPTMHISSV